MNIVVLAGGTSPERDVSLGSAKMIYQALASRGHQVILLDVYLGHGDEELPDAALLALFAEKTDWTAGIDAIKSKNPDIAAIKALRPDGGRHYFGPNVVALCRSADVVFIALHGENGENGKIQAFFDLAGITYTGTGHLGSALALDKTLSKELFRYHGIPTPAGISRHRDDPPMPSPAPIPYPCIVKANNGGSSVGVTIAADDAEYALALTEAFRYDDIALVEPYIEGREFSVGVLAGEALPVIEICPKQGFFDYHNKYQPGATDEICPAQLTAEMTAALQGLAVDVYRILRMSNYARIDFIIDGQGKIYCLEGNTLPGMAPTSLLPQEAAVAGIDFATLCEKIIMETLRKA